MRVRVKICGLTREDTVEAAVRAGADAVGFVFADSPRRVEPSRARRLSAAVPPFVARVAVLHHPSREEMVRLAGWLSPDWYQSDACDAAIVRPFAGSRFLPVFRDTPELPEHLECRFLLFEGGRSGSGRTVDWDRAAALARRHRLVLAGGLTPDNVAEAIRRVRPYGVDVSSGVESAPGVKDPRLIETFIRRVRSAEELAHEHC